MTRSYNANSKRKEVNPEGQIISVNKGGGPNWYSEGQVDELRQAYKDHNIKLSRKQAKRLWNLFRDCNTTTLIFF